LVVSQRIINESCQYGAFTVKRIFIGTLVLLLGLTVAGCKKKQSQPNQNVGGGGGGGSPGSQPASQPSGGGSGTNTRPPPADRWECGDGKCETDKTEDCAICVKDCGECDGCAIKVGSGCPGCRCESCVCKKLPDCCSKTGRWAKKCVEACKKDCGGCGLNKRGNPHPPVKRVK